MTVSDIFLLIFLFNSYASECDNHCQICNTNGPGKCDSNKCEEGYFYDMKEKKCFIRNLNCQQYSRQFSRTTCSSCNSTTDVLIDGKCKRCPQGCKGCVFTDRYFCSVCEKGYYLNSVKVCFPCPPGCETCNLMDSIVKCSSCLPTYGLKDGICQECKIKNCKECKEDASNSSFSCVKCLEKSFLNSNSCKKCPDNCFSCLYDGTYNGCIRCNEKYALNSVRDCIPCPSNCLSCIILAENKIYCQKCISNKYSLDIDGNCNLCSKVTFENCDECISVEMNRKAKCLKCREGYVMKSDNSSCINCDLDRCNECVHGNYCSKCKTGTFPYHYNTRCISKSLILKSS